MKTVGVRALKQNASAVVAEAAAGETITITDRGRPVAQVVPLPVDTRSGRLIVPPRLGVEPSSTELSRLKSRVTFSSPASL